ncbi:uncharacterized protein LOC134764135 [Penaeus indicus]|uniref:uncharacterized protein LOC134764135 n=1 Tax=Penaeus indicus TaxID=29960 RepID=UPI00300DB725
MGSIGCPLCCRQDFMSVVALHEHLLYYIYRPLRCAVCGSNAGGIQGLIHHLAQHLGDNPAGGVAKAGGPPPPPEIKRDQRVGGPAGSDTAVPLENGAINKEFLCASESSSRSNWSQNPEMANLAGRDEPVELTLRAYFCHCCGAKVVGKDKYFFHIKQHNTLLNTSGMPEAPNIILSAPQSVSCESDMAPGSHYTSASTTPVNVGIDADTLTGDELDPLDRGFPDSKDATTSRYMEENDTATQLLKLREWQLEKHGKRFKRQRLSFAKSPASSERSPMSGRQRNSNNSPGVTKQKSGRLSQNSEPCNYSLEKPPLSQISNASSTYPNPSPNSYKDNYASVTPQTNASASDEPQYTCAPAIERGSESEHESRKELEESECTFKTPEIRHVESNPKLIPSESQFHDNYTSSCTLQLQTPSLQSEAASSTYQEPEPINESENASCVYDNSKAVSLKVSNVDSQQDPSMSRIDSKITRALENREQLQPEDHSVIHTQNFQAQAVLYPPPAAPHFESTSEREIQQNETDNCFQVNTTITDSLRTLSESPNCGANSEVDIESSILVADSWISPHESAQYLELEPAFKSQGSFEQESCKSVAQEDVFIRQPTAQKRPELSEVMDNLDSLEECRTVAQPTHSYLEAYDKTALESGNVSTDPLQNVGEEEQSIEDLHVYVASSSHQLPETASVSSSTSAKTPSAEIPQAAQATEIVHEAENFPQEDNYRNITREEPSDYYQDYTAKPSESDACENEILPDYSAHPLPYLHKKFHHDQERKFALSSGGGQNADLRRYIHNFQSLLVSRLNASFSTDVVLKTGGEDLGSDEEEMDNQGTEKVEPAKTQRLQPSEHVCEVCKLECTDEVQLNIHYRTHEQGDQKNFTCQFCKSTFFMKSSKDRHERKHKGKKIYRCSQCQQVFNKAYILNRHRREVHAVKRPFKCDECDKDFTTSRNLQNHVGVHLAEKHHKCTHCDHTCHTASGLRTHIMEVHMGSRGRSFSCQECGEKFAKQYGLKRHMERKHGDGRVPCNICSKLFSCKEDLIKHTKSHENKSKGDLSCGFCNQTFTSAWSLQRHTKKHQTESHQFKCSRCPKSFTRKDSLLSHEKLHAQKKNYVCKCGKRFVKKSQLTAHEDKHSNVPKYSCDICKHSYKFKVSLRNHSCKPKLATEDAGNGDQVDA